MTPRQHSVSAGRRGCSPKLTRAQILTAALDLVRRDGRNALSMRSVASTLDTGTMSLYGHVRDKDDLIAGLGALALDRLRLGLDKRWTWCQRLARWMHSVRRQMVAHPEMFQLVTAQHFGSPQLLRATSEAAAILIAAGFDTRRAEEAAQEMLWIAFGFIMQEIGLRQNPPAEFPEHQLAAALASLSEDERARARPLLPHFAVRRFDRLYAATVRRLLAGLQAELNDGAD
jgi:AcrR family transcriptional regulator